MASGDRAAHGVEPLRIAIDVGGTFTDVVVAEGDRLTETKALTTHGDYAAGVLEGLRSAAGELGTGLRPLLERTTRIVHGTTVTTNALLGGSLPRVALVVTEGLRDTLGMRRGARDTPLWIRRDPPEVLVPRSRIFELDGRMDRRGQVVREPTGERLAAIVEAVRAADVAVVGVSLMFSFLDPAHERLVARHLTDALGGLKVYTSAAVLTRMGYFERTSTVAINAAVSPLLEAYLDSLGDALEREGFGGSLLVLQSNGGAAPPGHASSNGVYGVLSGPSVGPVAGVTTVAAHGIRSIISADMGGTSFDVSLVRDGAPTITAESVIAGHRIAVSTVEIHAIGAGGGSLVSLDRRGYVQVGPGSAGSEPGPACYARGGKLPTVTDANVILGHLDPEALAIDGHALDREAARAAMSRAVCGPTGMTPEDAAHGAYRLVNAAMADAIREVSVRRGHDPRLLPLVVGGGAGPLHVAAIAADLEIPLVVVPRLGPTYCAFGGLVTDLRYEFSAALTGTLAPGATPAVEACARDLEGTARETLAAEGFAGERQSLAFTLALRYRGQFHDVGLDLPPEELADLDADRLAERFHAAHLRQNGHCDPRLPVELVSLGVVATGVLDKPRLDVGVPERSGTPRPAGTRALYGGDGFSDVPVYDRVEPGQRVEGPAVVQWPHTTILVPEASAATAEEAGNLCLHAAAEALGDVVGRLHG